MDSGGGSPPRLPGLRKKSPPPKPPKPQSLASDKVNPAETAQKFHEGYTVTDGTTNRPPRPEPGNPQDFTKAEAPGVPGPLKDKMAQQGVPTDGRYANVLVHSKNDPQKPTESMPTNPHGAPLKLPVADRYHAGGNGAGGAVDQDLDSKRDGNKAAEGPDEVGKKSLHSSELLYHAQNTADPGSTATMKGHVSKGIINPETNKQIEKVHGGQPGVKTTPRVNPDGSENKDFAALKETPNFRPPVRMSEDHQFTGPGQPQAISTYLPETKNGKQVDKPAGMVHFPGTGQAITQPPPPHAAPPPPSHAPPPPPSHPPPPPPSAAALGPPSHPPPPPPPHKRSLRLRKRGYIRTPYRSNLVLAY